MKRVFLGGTCNESRWRDELIPMLKIDYFNPVVDDWTEDYRAEEERQKRKCDFNLFVITPKMTGVFAIAETVQLSLERPRSTLFCVLDEDDGEEFTEDQMGSIEAVKKLIEGNHAFVFDNLVCVAEHLNKSYVEISYNQNVIECTIKRDGPTQMPVGHTTYDFEQNELGDYVCEILNADHRKHLLVIPEFRIYKRTELEPDRVFTDEEESFIRRWLHVDDNNFLAFVNGHIDEFNGSRHAVRNLAVVKWQKRLPKMACPIEQQPDHPNNNVDAKPSAWTPEADIAIEGVSGVEEMVEINKNPEDEMTAFDHDFWKKWKLMGGERFKEYIKKNEQQFLDSPEFLWDKAMEKWERLITDKTKEPWPFEEDSDDG